MFIDSWVLTVVLLGFSGIVLSLLRTRREREQKEVDVFSAVDSETTEMEADEQPEGIRRDFVANVSHELKTPITLIKGFLETLQQGAMENKEKAEHFLNIMAKQVERLNFIIEDLLSLSRLELDSGKPEIQMGRTSVHKILESVIRDLELKAVDRKTTINMAGFFDNY